MLSAFALWQFEGILETFFVLKVQSLLAQIWSKITIHNHKFCVFQQISLKSKISQNAITIKAGEFSLVCYFSFNKHFRTKYITNEERKFQLFSNQDN